MDPSLNSSPGRFPLPGWPLLLLRLLHPPDPIIHDFPDLPVDLGPRLRVEALIAPGGHGETPARSSRSSRRRRPPRRDVGADAIEQRHWRTRPPPTFRVPPHAPA